MRSVWPKLPAGRDSYTAHALFSRYLIVGCVNTAFGYTSFAAFTVLLTDFGKYTFMVAYLMSSIVNITVSFLGYKWFVFKTRGHYFQEWLRTLGIYSAGILINVSILPFLVAVVQHFGYSSSAPYVAGAILTISTVTLSFFGHRKFSFNGSNPDSSPSDQRNLR